MQDWVRFLARRLTPLYAPAAGQLFASWRHKELSISALPGTYPRNPSLVVHQGQIWATVRTINYTSVNGRPVFRSADHTVRSQNHLARLDLQGEVVTSTPITGGGDGLPDARYQGLEDIRLFSHLDELWLSCTVCDRHPSGIAQIGVARIDCQTATLEPLELQDFGGGRAQKNWMPVNLGQEFGWIYSVGPTETLVLDRQTSQARVWSRNRPALALDHQRGSSQLIPWDDGWLCVTHEMVVLGARRRYTHRFVELDNKLGVRAVSDALTFTGAKAEFCAGMIRQGSELWIGFGVDRQAMLGRVEEAEVRSCLNPCPPAVELPCRRY
jgi:hypothetical protein